LVEISIKFKFGAFYTMCLNSSFCYKWTFDAVFALIQYWKFAYLITGTEKQNIFDTESYNRLQIRSWMILVLCHWPNILAIILYKYLLLFIVYTYTTQLLPKTVTCNLLTTWVVLCKSSTQLAYDNVGKLCAWFRQYTLLGKSCVV
jgi:hypothetical protein